MRVIEVTPDDQRWADFVGAHEDALVYHLDTWTEVLHQAFGYEPACLACVDRDERFLGLLPLVRKRGVLTGAQLCSLPHTPVAGPLAVNVDVAEALVREATLRVRDKRRSWLQVKLPTEASTSTGLEDRLAAFGGDLSQWAATYVLELPPPGEDLRFGNARKHGRTKRSVEKARKMGVQIREADSEDDLRAWYPLYLETMRVHLVPPLPYRFFRAMWRLLHPHGHIRLWLAEVRAGTDTVMLSGSIFLDFKANVVFAYNGRRTDGLKIPSNDALHWHSIHWAQQHGFRRYDFGEVRGHSDGLDQFKRKWSGEFRPMYRYYYPKRRGAEDRTPDGDGRTRAMVNAVWGRLPLQATAAVGGWLYGHL